MDTNPEIKKKDEKTEPVPLSKEELEIIKNEKLAAMMGINNPKKDISSLLE